MRFMASLSRSLRLIATVALIYVSPVGSAWAESAAQQPRSAAQLAQLVAPIALYPDALLSQVLMASTYPLEVVEAARWVQANPGVSGQALEDAMQKQSWDPSVKALTAVPQTLQMLNDKIDWTRQLGDAFLAQQADLLNAVQQLRARADASGNLKTTEQQTVTREPAPPQSPPPAQGAQQGAAPPSSAAPAYVYTIESSNPDQVYLPIYDPALAFGTWPYPDYEPYSWYPSGYYAGTGLTFAAAAVAGAAIWGTINWRRNNVGINPLRYNQFNRTNIAGGNWNHNPAHRGGVPYRDRNVAQRFGDQGKAASREAFRGKAEAGRRDLAKQGGAAKVAQKAGAGAQKAAGAKQAANKAAGAKNAGAKGAGAKQAARSKQGTQQKQAARSKQGGQARSKQAARSQQARPQQAARPRQTASRSQGAQHRPSPASHRAMAQRPSGMSHRGGGSGMRSGGGGRGGGGRGGGRRSDLALKHDIILLGRLENGLGFYRFAYLGSDKAYVGVMAQEVQAVMPAAVVRGGDGYLRVHYDKLGLELQTYDQWIASGARIPPRRVN